LNLAAANQDTEVQTSMDTEVHPFMERTSSLATGFSGIDFSIFDSTISLQQYPSSEGVLSPTVLSTPKNFPYGEPDSKFDGISAITIPQFKSAHMKEEPATSYALKENSNDDFLFEPVSQSLTESHSDTASDSELSTDNLFHVHDVGELDDILPVDGLSWMGSLPQDESTVFGLDSILS